MLIFFEKKQANFSSFSVFLINFFNCSSYFAPLKRSKKESSDTFLASFRGYF